MKAVVMHQTGGPDVLAMEEIDRPQAGDGEVLVKVRAASVNPIDWKFRRGLMPKELPAVLGNDVSGVVEESRVDGFAAGDAVFGVGASGAYAEFATSPAALLAPRPADLDDVHAAALPVAGQTAWQALFDRGGLQRGQTALIAGAAGGVGHLAVQFAKRAGAHVIGTGSARNRDYVLGLGADEFIDYGAVDVGTTVGARADVVFDTVGGETTAGLLAAVRDGGVLVTIAGGPPDGDAERGVRAELLIMSPNPAQLAEIGALVARGEVNVEIAEVLPLGDASRAHELSESGHTRGKIVLTVGD